MIDPGLRYEVERLIYNDMRLLDERGFSDWLRLYPRKYTYCTPSDLGLRGHERPKDPIELPSSGQE